jgi:hypothetical protein
MRGVSNSGFAFGESRPTYQIKLISPIQKRMDIIADVNRRPAQCSSVFSLILIDAKKGRKIAHDDIRLHGSLRLDTEEAGVPSMSFSLG